MNRAGPTHARRKTGGDLPQDWSNAEVGVAIDAYLGMLRAELDFVDYSKAGTNREVQAETGRTRSSIEFKFGNISSALRDMGRVWIRGYKPYSNYQAMVRTNLEERASAGELDWLPRIDAQLEEELMPETGTGTSVDHLHSQSNYWKSLEKLWDKATGGPDAAAQPAGDDGFWPVAPSAAGLDEAADWFSSTAGSAGPSKFLVLLGGPGAGKSLAAARIVNRWAAIDPPTDGLAHRRYRYQAGDREVLLINDATIPGSDHDLGALREDIDSSVELQTHLLACVNRGVLVEELAGSRSHVLMTPAHLVLKWLHSNAASIEDSEDDWLLKSKSTSSYIRSATLCHEGEVRAELVAVLVDACSLLEPRPSVAVNLNSASAPTLSGGEYRICRFGSRRALVSDDVASLGLLRDVISQVGSLPDSVDATPFPYDPIAANVLSLNSPEVRSGVMSVLRGAEICSGRRFTYRELWGAISRTIVGDLTDRIQREHLQDWLAANQPTAADAQERFVQLQRLGGLRFSQAIYGLASDADALVTSRNPVTLLTSAVDPNRDAVPGKNNSAWDAGWATPVVDAFAAPSRTGSPLENLLDVVDGDDVLHLAVTPFDHEIDMAFVAATSVGGLPDSRRHDLIAWYGSYLSRLYATANGIPAFRSEVTLWTLAWDTAPATPDALRTRLMTLLAPRRNPDLPGASFLLPVFDARATPVVGSLPEPKLALRVSQTEVVTERDLESLFVTLKQDGSSVATIELDFPLLREALSCAEGRLGITEYSHRASPRLERVRASSLVPHKLAGASLCVVVGDVEEAVAVQKSNGSGSS
jgi:hypothetical protein